MKLRDLTIPLYEAPLGDYQTHGFERGPNEYSFDTIDQKLLPRKQYTKRVENAFRNTKQRFNLFFVNSDFLRDNTKLNPEFSNLNPSRVFYQAIDQFPMIITGGNQIEGLLADYADLRLPRDRSINCVFLSNMNPDSKRIPMTPWIIAHRLVHGIFDAQDRGNSPKMVKTHSSITQGQIFMSMDTIFYLLLPTMTDKLITSNGKTVLELLGTFKSARENTIEGNEAVIELGTQYLIQGKITFKSVSDEETNQKIQIEVDRMNESFRGLFDILQGHTILTI